MSYRWHLSSGDDLVTPYEAVRAGFVALALEKNRRATPFVAEARALKVAAMQAKTPSDLLKIEDIQRALLTAAGISDKANEHLSPENKFEAINELVRVYLEPAGKNFVEELVYRFLLTRGDTLGGSMRNWGGALAERKLTRAIIAALALSGKEYQWLNADDRKWAHQPKDDTGIEYKVKGLAWKHDGQSRTLIYNIRVPLVNKNVDLCLLSCSPAETGSSVEAKQVYQSHERYIALGELKGGIDPAGADEHWKTAGSALERIRSAFRNIGLSPDIFFIGAAIEKEMAGEIWHSLETGALANSANLTNENHIASISRWLTSL